MKMFKNSLTFIAISLIFSALSVSRAQESFSTIDPLSSPDIVEQPISTNQIINQDIVDTDLVFFEDAISFNESCEDLAIEDFDETNVEPDSSLACPGPFSSITNNDCYSQGALVQGFSLAALGTQPLDLIVVTPPSFNVTNAAVGPNTLKNDTQFSFDPPESGVGLFIVTPLSSGILTIEIYGPGDVLLGSADLNMAANNTGTFLGVTTEDLISRIVLNNNGQSIGELLYEIQYGDCGLSLGDPNVTTTVPTLSYWALIAMAGIFGIVGLMVMRRRKTTA